MKDNDVIEIAKICSGGGCDASCTFEDGTNAIDECMGAMIRSLCDIIKRKDTEIDILIRKKETLKDEVSELKEELFFAKQKRANFFELVENYEKGRVAGYKEFAERLKAKGTSPELDEGKYYNDYDIDRTLAEMESERE